MNKLYSKTDEQMNETFYYHRDYGEVDPEDWLTGNCQECGVVIDYQDDYCPECEAILDECWKCSKRGIGFILTSRGFECDGCLEDDPEDWLTDRARDRELEGI